MKRSLLFGAAVLMLSALAPLSSNALAEDVGAGSKSTTSIETADHGIASYTLAGETALLDVGFAPSFALGLAPATMDPARAYAAEAARVALDVVATIAYSRAADPSAQTRAPVRSSG